MAVKQLHTMEPVRVITDKLGRKIEVRRGGILDTNKYAKRGKMEAEMRANMGNSRYKPTEQMK